jgi:predicted regulator of Ras-like GTPase activity (Roadblock/LC7/MglB family)
VTTATAESRVIEYADNLPVGQLLLVILEVDAGDLTIDSDDADVVLDTAGDFALFVVVKSSATAQVWQIVSNTTMVDEVAAATTGLGGATLPADTSALTKLELSAKTDVDEIAAALIALTDALLAAGVIDTTLTQATK